MKVTLPHWLAIVVVGVGVVLDGLSHLPQLASYALPITAAGNFLITGGLAGALVLPSIKGGAS